MSSVSADAPEAAADLTAPANGSRGAPAGAASGANSASTDFGPNEWLVDELYQRYQADPGSVDRAWWNFFADYHPRPVEHPPAADPARPAPAGPPVPAQAGPAQAPTPVQPPPRSAPAGTATPTTSATPTAPAAPATPAEPAA